MSSTNIVLVFSNSGETEELAKFLPAVKKIGAKIIAITGRRDSSLARYSDIVISIGKIEEVCPLGLAPTSSTTAMLAIGDAIALCVVRHRGFDKERFALYHPGGEIGRRLLKGKWILKRSGRVLGLLILRDLRDILR